MKSVDFYGIPMVGYNEEELIAFVDGCLDDHRQTTVFGLSSWTFYLFSMYDWYYAFMCKINLNLFDGRPIYYIATILGYSVKCKLSIPEFVQLSLNLATKKESKVFLLGASISVNSLAVENLCKRGIIAGGHNGYFNVDSEHEVSHIISEIVQFSPDILMIGISTPMKENFVMKYLDQLPNCLIVLCGGMIDILAGTTNQTPSLLKNLGLGFLYRFVQEPKRLMKRTILGSTRFLWISLPKLIWLRIRNSPLQQR